MDVESLADTIIYRDNESIKIIAHKELKETLVDIDELNWHYDEESEHILTLKDISDQLDALGYDHVYYVWTELGLSGRIYMHGNYDPPEWQQHGTTKGYA